MMTGFVYMMSNQPRGVIYTGVTSDLQGRTWEHRNHVQPGFTSKYNAEKLVWFEQHPNIVLAIQREKSLKRYRREWKIELIEGLNPTWDDLFERIGEIENIYRPHPKTMMWDNYNWGLDCAPDGSPDPRDKPEDDVAKGGAALDQRN